MKSTILCCMLALTWLNAAAERDPMDNPGMFEGDMLGVELDENRNAIPRDELRWPGGIIPYIIDSNLTGIHLDMLKAAMTHIEEKTCIKFVPRTNEKDYVKAFYGSGCHAHWGRIGMGEQNLSLGEKCGYFGTAIHELLHAVGFEHEHNRPDRDDYITIYWENVADDKKKQFKKLAAGESRLLTPFDYDSVMLYGSTSFAKVRGLTTMLTINKEYIVEVYDRWYGMSQSDIQRVKMLYECP